MAGDKKEAIKKESKKESKKEFKFWKITGPGWTQSVLRPKYATSERTLKSIKSKKGYKVEEA
tara:strand:+ start:1753 stop:1938 length:186 start_codon:yes stop_codon:yes gene_type:complete